MGRNVLAQEGPKDEITCDCQGMFKAYTNLADLKPLFKVEQINMKTKDVILLSSLIPFFVPATQKPLCKKRSMWSTKNAIFDLG